MIEKIDDKSSDLLEIAKIYGIENDLFFKNTFERYQKQLVFLNSLKMKLKKMD